MPREVYVLSTPPRWQIGQSGYPHEHERIVVSKTEFLGIVVPTPFSIPLAIRLLRHEASPIPCAYAP